MSELSDGRDAFEQVAAEFLERYRRGERPTISEYAVAHPELADEIRELFPAVMLAEQLPVNREAESAQRSADTTAAPPKFLGEYRLLGEVGRGGMGIVYEAVQESLGRHVALKVLPHSALLSSTYRERFQREARAAARLHHSNIVPVFGVGEHDGIHYYAMQFIHGQGLDAVLRQVQRLRGQAKTYAGKGHTAAADLAADVAQGLTTGQFAVAPVAAREPATPGHVKNKSWPASRPSNHQSSLSSHSDVQYFRGVARVGVQVAQALAYAHQQGILHRDIKPSNLLMDTRGTVWVTDFGLAKTEDDAELTNTGDLVGTLRYMAPERFRGDSEPRGDLFSLGVTLYELLTLRPAFIETDRARLIEQVLHSDPPPPRRLDHRIPRDLETIVLKAMAKEPRDRYVSADLLADDLQRFLADRPILARRTPLPERVWRWCRRNPRLAGLTALAAMLLLVILIGSPIMSVRLWEQRQRAVEELWVAHLARAEASRLTNQAGRRFNGLKSLDSARLLLPSLTPEPSRTLDIRNQFIACLSLGDLGVAREWAGYPPGSAAVCFDEDLERYARSNDRGDISIRRVADDEELALLPGPEIGAWSLKFSPDGRFLAAGYRRKHETMSEQFRVWHCERRETVWQVQSTSGCGEADFSFDSRRVAFSKDPKTLSVIDLTSEKKEEKNLSQSALPNVVAFDPDGKKLAIARQSHVELRDIETGKIVSEWTQGSDVWSLAWRGDGSLLAASSGRYIYLRATKNGQLLATLRGHEHIITALAFNHGGDVLASKSHDGTVRLWEIGTEQQLVRTPCVYTGCAPLIFSPDDHRLGFASDGARLRLWDVARNKECRTLVVRHPSGLQSNTGHFSPDGRLLAVAHNDRIQIWDWAAGQQVGSLPLPDNRFTEFSADGRNLLTTSRDGLQRWPITLDPRTGQQTFASPESLVVDGPLDQFSMCRDGHTFVARRGEAAIVLRTAAPGDAITISGHPQLRYVAVSPDGQSVATGTMNGQGVKIWHAGTGALQRELPVESSAAVEFSPDGNWLVVGAEKEYILWDTRTWQPAHVVDKQPTSVPGGMTFTADGGLLAVGHSPTQIRLIDPATGRSVALMETPTQLSLNWHTLSADGRRLAAACSGGVIHVWDLHLIRQQLAKRNLDW